LTVNIFNFRRLWTLKTICTLLYDSVQILFNVHNRLKLKILINSQSKTIKIRYILFPRWSRYATIQAISIV